MVSREAQKEATRQALLASARDQFEVRGFDAVSMREIAQAAGVSAGAIYVHFPDKSALLMEAFREDIELVVIETIQSEPGPEVGLEARLLHMARALLTYYARRPALSVELVQKIFWMTHKNEALLAQLDAFLARLTLYMREAMARKELRDDVDLEVFVRAFFAQYTSVVIGGVQGLLGDVDAQMKLLGAMLNQHMRGVVPSEPPAPDRTGGV